MVILNYLKYDLVSNLWDTQHIVVGKKNRFCKYLDRNQISTKYRYTDPRFDQIADINKVKYINTLAWSRISCPISDTSGVSGAEGLTGEFHVKEIDFRSLIYCACKYDSHQKPANCRKIAMRSCRLFFVHFKKIAK